MLAIVLILFAILVLFALVQLRKRKIRRLRMEKRRRALEAVRRRFRRDYGEVFDETDEPHIR